MNNSRKDVVLTWMIITIASALFFAMNWIVPFFSDDYHFPYQANKVEKICNFEELIGSVVQDYYDLHGRIWCNLFSHANVSLLSEHAFDIVNTIVYLLVLWMSGKYLFRDNRYHVGGWIALVVGYFLINTKDLFYWAVGSSNYLWAMMLTLPLLILAKRLENVESRNWNIIYGIISFFLILTHEAFAIAVTGYLVLYYLILYREKYSSPIGWLLAGTILGTLFIVMAPGTLSKLGTNAEQTGIDVIGILKRLIAVLNGLTMTYVAMTTYLVLRWNGKIKGKPIDDDITRMFILAMMGTLPAFIAGDGGRAVFVAEWASVMMLTLIVTKIAPDSKSYMVEGVIFIGLVAIYGVIIAHSNSVWNEFRSLQFQYWNEDKTTVIVDDSEKHPFFLNRYIRSIDSFDLRSLWREKRYRYGHDVKPISIMPYSVLEAINNPRFPLFTIKNKVDGESDFYTLLDLDWYITPYDSNVVQAINNGCLSLTYHIKPVVSVKLTTNMVASEAVRTHAIQIIQDERIGDYILINKRYKNFAWTSFERLDILKKPAIKKFVITIK